MSNEAPAQSDSIDPASAHGERIEIHNWPAPYSPITDDTPLIRYMKLETFLLLLLGDQIFIPTLKLLQQADRSEGLVPLLRGRPDEILSILRQHEEWLLKEAGNPDVSSIEDENVRRIHTDALAEESWRHELAKRRCVSCWNRSEKQINFMWRIYGDRGVAVFSTVGRIRRALADAGAKGIVSPVLYIPTEDTIPAADYDLLNQNYRRPYLFKDWSYSPEQEVRFVFEVDPRQTKTLNGVLVQVSAKTIIDKVYFSRQIPSSEEDNLKKFVYERRFSRSFFPPGKEPRPRPLTVESDLPPCIFPDLDLTNRSLA
jgi:hypothetical protein